MKLQFEIDRKRYCQLLIGVVGFLLAMHATLAVYHYEIAEVEWYFYQLFDVDEEHNLPTFFSGYLLISAAFLLWLNLKTLPTEHRFLSHWRILFLGFCALSIDEIAGLHETVNSVTEASWAFGGALIAAMLAVYFWPFLWQLPKHLRVGYIVSGALFVGGSVGMEFVGEPMESDSLIYALTTIVEEGLEMSGVILFSYFLLGEMESRNQASN